MSVAWSRVPLQQRVHLPPAVVALEADVVAADLVLQVGQQGRRQPFPFRQVAAVLADDGGQGAQVPVAGPYRSARRSPRSSLTCSTVRRAAGVGASVERRIAGAAMASPHSHLTDQA